MVETKIEFAKYPGVNLAVKVYDTRAAMRAACKRMSSAYQAGFDADDPPAAITTSYVLVVDDDVDNSALQAVIYFNRQDLGASIVVHECTHVALRAWRFMYGGRAVDFNENEEPFCYLMQDIFWHVNIWLINSGIY